MVQLGIPEIVHYLIQFVQLLQPLRALAHALAACLAHLALRWFVWPLLRDGLELRRLVNSDDVIEHDGLSAVLCHRHDSFAALLAWSDAQGIVLVRDRRQWAASLLWFGGSAQNLAHRQPRFRGMR